LKQFGFLWESRGQTSRVEASTSPLPLTITLSVGH
jgi:hypothetical protein